MFGIVQTQAHEVSQVDQPEESKHGLDDHLDQHAEDEEAEFIQPRGRRPAGDPPII